MSGEALEQLTAMVKDLGWDVRLVRRRKGVQCVIDPYPYRNGYIRHWVFRGTATTAGDALAEAVAKAVGEGNSAGRALSAAMSAGPHV